jgi:hypothetical protein
MQQLPVAALRHYACCSTHACNEAVPMMQQYPTSNTPSRAEVVPMPAPRPFPLPWRDPGGRVYFYFGDEPSSIMPSLSALASV